MSKASILAALIVLTGAGEAPAEAAGKPNHQPTFTAAEAKTIARNEMLSGIVDSDPRLVRRILDLMAKTAARRARGHFATPPEGFDATKNPDVSDAARSAWGSSQWIDLARRAKDIKARKDREQAEGPTGEGRSYRGSAELLERLKQAKDAKESGPAGK